MINRYLHNPFLGEWLPSYNSAASEIIYSINHYEYSSFNLSDTARFKFVLVDDRNNFKSRFSPMRNQTILLQFQKELSDCCWLQLAVSYFIGIIISRNKNFWFKSNKRLWLTWSLRYIYVIYVILFIFLFDDYFLRISFEIL